MRPVVLALLCVAPLAPAAGPPVRLEERITAVDFLVGDELVGTYVHGGPVAVEKGDGTKPLAKPVLYPLTAPGGVNVTRPYPLVRSAADATKDHFHHKSAWFCHGDVIPDGIGLGVRSGDKRVEGVDFWAEGANHGRIVCTKAEPAGTAAIATHNDWTAPDGTVILTEKRTVSLRVLPAGRLFVFDIDLHADKCGITFGDTKEGSFGVRVADGLRADKGTGKLTNAAGKAGEKDVWGYQSPWCDYSGTVDGKAVGVAIFDHPANQPPAAWHARGYGLMAANPFGRAGSGFPSQKGKKELVKLAKGDHLKLKYAIYTHTGDATTGDVAGAYKAFAK